MEKDKIIRPSNLFLQLKNQTKPKTKPGNQTSQKKPIEPINNRDLPKATLNIGIIRQRL